MLQNRSCLIIVLPLMMMLSRLGMCQTNNVELSRRESNAPMYEFYRSNFQPNQQAQAGGMPFIVKDVNYNDVKPLRGPDRNSENTAACTDKKISAQIEQKTCPGGPTGEEMGSPSPVSGTKQSAPAASQGSPTSAGAMSAPSTNPSGGSPSGANPSVVTPSAAMTAANQNSPKLAELQKLVQQLYVAQAQVQLEATEIQRAQAIAVSAQQALEEAGNNVRVIQAALHAAQETVAGCALRAQTAQLQLAAHDQLLFTARQRVDALSAQMVGLQAEEGIGENKIVVDLPALLAKLKEPLPENQKPTPVPSILGSNSGVSPSSAHSVASEPSMDPSKLYNQLKAWNDQHTGRRAEPLVEKKQSLYDSLLLEGYGDDSLEESPGSTLDTHLGLNEESKAVPATPTVGELSEEDIRTLVDFIVSTGRNKPGESGVEGISPDDLIQRAENAKYIDDFLSNIRNTRIRSVQPGDVKANVAKSSRFDPKLTDRLLSLHESVFHPAIIKQGMSNDEHEEDAVELDGAVQKVEYDDPNEFEDQDELKNGIYQ